MQEKAALSDTDLLKEIEFLRAEVRRLRNRLAERTPPLSVLLRRRGFRIYKKEPSDDLLLPSAAYIESYYGMLKRYSFRLFLRDLIKHQPRFTLHDVTRYATREVTLEYIGYLVGIGMAVPEGELYRLAQTPVKSFGSTLEWFLSEIFRRELASETVWGVKMKRPGIGGDYDLLAKIDGSILAMEVKSSPPKQIYQSEIRAFFDRSEDLMPELAIFFMDTELRMKDKIVPMFEEELKRRFPDPPEVTRLEKELFEVQTERPRVFIINAKDSIIANIEKVLAQYFRQ
ncbi:MAG: hypothetical protein HGA78_01270 [Nitrospirales bacterium]|nr:hypothetical protein [Nitrospirales bacterium]